MNWVDILVILITILLVLAVVFGKWIYPAIKNKGKKKTGCPNCSSHAAKSLRASYYHEKRKEERKKRREQKKQEKEAKK